MLRCKLISDSELLLTIIDVKLCTGDKVNIILTNMYSYTGSIISFSTRGLKILDKYSLEVIYIQYCDIDDIEIIEIK